MKRRQFYRGKNVNAFLGVGTLRLVCVASWRVDPLYYQVFMYRELRFVCAGCGLFCVFCPCTGMLLLL